MRRLLRPDPRFASLFATVALLVLMFAIGGARYPGFLSAQVIANVVIDNAFLIVLAVGMTFVILTGGIDLSVGAVLALTTMLGAWLLEVAGWPLWAVLPSLLLVGTAFGLVMGLVIHFFDIEPFIVTLAGMFMARGLCYLISLRTISITDETFRDIAFLRVPVLGGASLSAGGVVALVLVAVAALVLHRTRLGRGVYAIGGSAQSALLMGLPVGRIRVTVYAISGFCSALAGILFASYMLSGYALHAVGMELEAIAAVVIGGTLLTGGYGYVAGSLLGVLVLGTIQTIITFQGTLSSWWTKIAIGVLLCLFILVQRAFGGRGAIRGGGAPHEQSAPAVVTEPAETQPVTQSH